MIAAIVVLGLVILLLLVHQDRERRAWERERHVLLERIQAPERVSLAPQGEPQEPLHTDGAALALVGAVVESEEEIA